MTLKFISWLLKNQKSLTSGSSHFYLESLNPDAQCNAFGTGLHMQGDAFIILEPESAFALDHGYAGLSHKIGAGKVTPALEAFPELKVEHHCKVPVK